VCDTSGSSSSVSWIYNEGSEYTMIHIELSAYTFIHIYWMDSNIMNGPHMHWFTCKE
jgi:hypothetical protein